ncbi:LOW QUALITY PROTEIN: starch synthase 4 [Populus alba x Populus x berolinensis]|nr:LOW QUALITY PROTEIN: starch synthase 4 [Populus alba x Populus x berolinensis]
MRKESGSSLSKSQEKKKLPSDNHNYMRESRVIGIKRVRELIMVHIFGPSQPVISQRVIQESKSIIENQHLALRVPNAQHTNKKSSSSTATGLKNRVHGLVPKVKNEVKTKVQKLKDTRDYSFLLTDDAELPAPTKEPAPRNVSAQILRRDSAQVPQKIKQASSNSGRNIHGIREERKPVFRNGQMHPKVGSQKPSSANKPDASSINSRRQLATTGLGLAGLQGQNSCLQRHLLHHAEEGLITKSSDPKQHWEQRKGLQEPNKARPMPKQPLYISQSSKFRLMASLQDNRPKKKPARPFPDAGSDDEDAFKIKNRGNYDDEDDSDMEANFDDIMKEERRESVINSTIPLTSLASQKSNPSIHHQKTVKARRHSSKNSNNGGDANGLLKEEEEEKYNDTWLLFKEAQQNILYLNKLRLVAVEELNKANREKQLNGFHIIQICTEMEPLVSVGSLSSYVTGLSKALQKKGHMVEVILPNIVHGIGVTLIQPLYYSSFFDRERVYGYSDDFERFTYFSRASLDYIAKSGKQPDVLHIHNWETAIVGPLFWDIFVKQGLGGTRVLLTCHGFDSQCLEQPDKQALCGLDPARLHRPDRLQDHTMTHLVNILKGGLVYSNKVVMVQSIYSKERIINSFGHGLEPTLAIHKDKLLVSPCGFDNSTWDPSKDKFLPKNYSADDLKGKSICKVALQQQLGLSKNSSTVLVGCISTESLDFDLNNQKAIWNATQKNVQKAIWNATQKNVQVCTCFWDLYFFEREYRLVEMRVLKKVTRTVILNFPWQPHESDETVRFINKYDEALLHLIFAGSDIILCQSFHDPLLQVPVSRELFSSKQNLQCICFLSGRSEIQLKALKYGAAPVAIMNKRPLDFHGSLALPLDILSLSQAVDEINSPSKWKQKIVDAMAKDFSWNAECYDVHVSAYTALKSL